MSEQAGAAQPVAIIDGSNAAYSTEGGGPRLENILLVSRKLRDEGYRPVLVVDAALRHNIDRKGSSARDLDASVVSNDRFRERRQAFPEARERVIRYMIVDRDVVLKRRLPRRRGEGADSARPTGAAGATRNGSPPR